MEDAGRREREARFETLVSGRRPALVRAAARIVRDGAEAEDVVQETLERVWQRLDAVAPGALKAYLFRAVELNALKRRSRRKESAFGGPLDALADVPATKGGTEPEDPLDPLELERALAGLPTTQQAVLRMKFYAGMTFREIGAALTISTNTASSRCRYGIEALRKALGGMRPKTH